MASSTLQVLLSPSRDTVDEELSIDIVKFEDESVEENVLSYGVGVLIANVQTIVNLTPNTTGYIAVRISCSKRQLLGLNVSLRYQPGTTTVFRHVVHPGVYDHLKLISSCRVAGISALMTNPTPEMLKGGVIEMYQTPPGKLWSSWTSDSDALAKLPSNRWERFSYDKGGYMYNKPEGVEGFNPLFLREFSDDSGTLGMPLPRFMPLAPRSWTIAIIRPPTQISVTFNPIALCSLLLSAQVTFSTRSQWQVTSVPRMLPVSTMSQELRVAPQFFENKSHLANIRDFLNHAGNFLKKWTPRIASGAMTLAGFLTADPVLAASGIGGIFGST